MQMSSLIATESVEGGSISGGLHGPARGPRDESVIVPPTSASSTFVRPGRFWFILTLLGVLILIASTVLMFVFIHSTEHHTASGPCLQLRVDRVGKCRATRLLLQVSGVVLFIFGFFLLQMSAEIRRLSWVKEGSRKLSVILFLFALGLSNFPTFISPHTSYGYWCSTAYHVYFLGIETVLAVRTNTNLHSTFASINLTCGCIYLLADHDTRRRWLWPSLVLVIAGIGHVVSYFWIERRLRADVDARGSDRSSILSRSPFFIGFWRDLFLHGFWVIWLAPSMLRLIFWEGGYVSHIRTRLVTYCCTEIRMATDMSTSTTSSTEVISRNPKSIVV